MTVHLLSTSLPTCQKNRPFHESRRHCCKPYDEDDETVDGSDEEEEALQEMFTIELDDTIEQDVSNKIISLEETTEEQCDKTSRSCPAQRQQQPRKLFGFWSPNRSLPQIIPQRKQSTTEIDESSEEVVDVSYVEHSFLEPKEKNISETKEKSPLSHRQPESRKLFGFSILQRTSVLEQRKERKTGVEKSLNEKALTSPWWK